MAMLVITRWYMEIPISKPTQGFDNGMRGESHRELDQPEER